MLHSQKDIKRTTTYTTWQLCGDSALVCDSVLKQAAAAVKRFPLLRDSVNLCLFVLLWGRQRSPARSQVVLQDPLTILHLSLSEKLLLFFSLQPVPTSPTSTSPTPGGTLGMSKMDAPSMQDVYILSPVSGLYSTRSDAHPHRCSVVIIMLIIRIQLMTLMTVMITALLSPGRSWVWCHVTTSAATAWAPSPAPKVQRRSVTIWTRTAVSTSPC